MSADQKKYYTVERGHQILISLLKQHGIRKIVASPGTTNMTFVGSVMNDPFFEVYSSVDERSAAYIAVGMAEESGEAVVITCTGATASRNYMPGLTEAYYRKLPILAVTATQNENRIGHLIPQVLDRSTPPKDVCVLSEHVDVPQNANDEWDATIRLNRALLALNHHGGGPVHINLATGYSKDFSVKELPTARCIRRYMPYDKLPPLPKGRIGIAVGSHLPWSASLTDAVNSFCKAYGAVVFCEHGSNYSGPFRVYNAIVGQQLMYTKPLLLADVLIHIGEVSGYGKAGVDSLGEVWRVNEDGEIRDHYHKLSNVFEMKEEEFFLKYAAEAGDRTEQQENGKIWIEQCRAEYRELNDRIQDLPFSNLWIAWQTAHRLPKNSVLHLGILSSLRAWGLFEVTPSLCENGFANTGGFGIDGCMSSMIGGAIVRPDKLHFLVIGDLAFFYDMNVIGNRHIKNNVRILLVNNGKGTEFRNYSHPTSQFGEDADPFMAAAGHYGNKSPFLVRHMAEDLGFEYLHASGKDEYLKNVDRFLTAEKTEKPMIFEVFTTSEDESDALKLINTLKADTITKAKIELCSAIPHPLKRALKKIIN